MAVLQKIRVKFGLAISIIIALALLSFIIDPGTLQSAVQTMSSKYDVGKINGKSIPYTDFVEEVEKFSNINEMLTGTSAQNEETQASIRDAAWQNLVDKYLFIKNAKDAGLVVGDQEMVDLTTGDNPSQIITQLFMDPNGNFDPQNVVEFVRSIPDDQTGRYQALWDYVQNTVYTQQFYNKYSALFNNSDIQSPLMLRRAIEENNTTANVDFVLVPFGYDNDTSIVITTDEVKKYYDSHKKFYEQDASRDIEYIVYEVIPSEADINSALETVNGLYEEFSTTDNMRNFLTRNSDRALSTYWYKPGELATVSSQIDQFAFDNASVAGSVSPVIREGDIFYVAKVMDAAPRSDSVFVKHILLQDENAQATADSLVQVIKKGGVSFSDLAAQYSVDQGSAYDGEFGAIGWMTQNYMIQGMESVLDAKVNEPFTLSTLYGTHVVLVTEKTRPMLMKQIAIFEKDAVASRETFNDYYAKANKFANLAAGGYENFRAAVDSMGIYAHPLSNVKEGNSVYGSIDNAKEVTRWIFDAKKNAVSNIITVNNNYFFVVALKDIHKEGIAPVQDVVTEIRDVLYLDKLAVKMTEETAKQIEGLDSLEAIAEKLNTSVSSVADVAFSSLNTQGLDPKLLGAISAAPENKICGPVAGTIGVYVFEVTGRNTGAFYTEDDAKNLKTQMNQYNSQMIIPVMEEASNYKDNRARFF